MKIVYVMKDVGRSGGVKVIFEHANRLTRRGHEVEVAYLSSNTSWFGEVLFKKVRLNNPGEIVNYLKSFNGIKIATWWETAPWVSQAGGGYYFVQDIESSYYSDNHSRQRILDTYRLGLKHLVENSFIEAILRLIFGAEVKRISIAIDHEVFKPLKAEKEIDGLYCYRNQLIKNPALMEQTLKLIKKELPNFKLHSYSDEQCGFADVNHVSKGDRDIALLMNQAKVFISTSDHEGFCLPILEAMACGNPVVSTRAIGNESFCVDGVNCLLADDSEELAKAIISILIKPKLASYISSNAKRTAQRYRWDKAIDGLENIFGKVQPIKVEIVKGKSKTYTFGIPDEEIFAIKSEHIITRDGRKVLRYIG